jgi:hypothetical protein
VIKQCKRRHGGHGGITNCLDCGEKILNPCAITDEHAGLSKMNVYAECYDSRKKPPVAEVDVPTWESASLTSSGTSDREEVKDSILMLGDSQP